MNKYNQALNFLDSVVDDNKITPENSHNYDLSYSLLYELALKQEPKELVKEAPNKYRCPTCNAIHTPDSLPDYCFNCGQKFKK